MAHLITHDTAPDTAVREIHRERKREIIVIVIAVVLAIITFGGATALMYSDAPDAPTNAVP